ncbi:MAG: hypothetical protein V7K90_04765 [Nostoc sp.]|uniref:hypothetical protein n=1 Tax=Nostoc sp. TaxID=1180 RepID=UPI002FF46093
MSNINVTDEDSDWYEWWVDPVKSGSSEADPQDLQATKQYIEKRYTPETQEKITIKVRSQPEE